MPLSKAKKADYFEKMDRCLSSYNKVFVVQVDNVGSQQLQVTRKQMRGTAEILMGKNTFMRKVFDKFLSENPDHPFQALLPLIKGNIGFVFTNDSLPKVRDMILANKVPAPARPGAIAPIDVTIPAGPTGCDPGQTNFFQVLQVPTKIVKGQIEITTPMSLIKAGDKVGPSEATLLTKLNIRPFSYGLIIEKVYDSGALFDVDILDIDDNALAARFTVALNKISAISLATGYVTQASMAHSMAAAFQTLVAVVIGVDNYSFEQAQPYKDFIANPGAFASAGGGGAAATEAAPAAAPQAAVEEVDALDGGMDMFGGGGSDY
jgi:large subunit ribosomal protein LP0